jgi:hypothetical protein
MDHAVMRLAMAMDRWPHNGGPQLTAGGEHVLPVVAQGQRHAGRREGLEHGSTLVERGIAGIPREEPYYRWRLGVRRHLMHGECDEGTARRCAGCARLFEDVGDVGEGHRGIGDTLRPAVLADGRAARDLHTQADLPVHGLLPFAGSPEVRPLLCCLHDTLLSPPLGGASETPQQQAKAGHLDEPLTRLDLAFVVLGQPSVADEPSEAAFHNPAAWLHAETARASFALDDFQVPAAILLLTPVGQLLAAVGCICPDLVESWQSEREARQELAGANRIVYYDGASLEREARISIQLSHSGGTDAPSQAPPRLTLHPASRTDVQC